MNNATRAAFGQRAAYTGSPHIYDQSDPEALTDSLANMMHFADRYGLSFADAFSKAKQNFEQEAAEEESPL